MSRRPRGEAGEKACKGSGMAADRRAERRVAAPGRNEGGSRDEFSEIRLAEQERSKVDVRCGCGNLLAKLVGGAVELKCRRCKHTWRIPLPAR